MYQTTGSWWGEWYFSLGLGFLIYEALKCIFSEEMSFPLYSFILVSSYNIYVLMCMCLRITYKFSIRKKTNPNHLDEAKANLKPLK